MKALITGGAGFLGSNLCADLLEKSYEVVVVDNLSTGSRENIGKFEKLPQYSFFEMSIESPLYQKTFFENNKWQFDEVYHLACPTGVPNIEKLGEEMVDACSMGTKNVLQTALESGARLVFTSSCEVYGDPQISPQIEDYTGNVHPQGPRANYEEGKRFSETLLKLFVTKYGLDARTTRLFNVYGPNMHVSDTRVIPTFVQAALRNDPLPVHGDGSQKRTLSYVSDIVNGLQAAIRKGKSGEVYNLGSNDEMTMLDLARKVIEATGSQSVIEYTEGFAHDHKHRMPSLEKIRSLGWKRKIELEEGLRNTAEYFRERMESEEIRCYPNSYGGHIDNFRPARI